MANAQADEQAQVDLASPEANDTTKKQCCNCFDGNVDAKGYAFLGMGRGMLVMSNIFFSQALLVLAKDAAGCTAEDEADGATCTKKIYGFTPSSLITNIAAISGLLAAFFMPICGALVDFTPYRRLAGQVVAIVMILIQGVQIYTVENTWFIMSILQAIAAVLYQLQIVVIYAYLPDIAGEVGETTMTHFTSWFQGIQFSSQAVFLVVIAAIQTVFKTSTVLTAQISQGINTFSSLVFFGIGWFLFMTPRPPARDLPEGQTIFTAGFRQNWKTAKSIQKHYKRGLRWYFLAVVFAEASAAAITSVSVVYLSDTLKLDSTGTAIFFLVTLIGTLPGCKLASFVTSKSNPNTSWKLSMLTLFVIMMIGALVLESVPSYCAYIWAFFVGIALGWFYPTENLFFSMCLPKGQEAELAGFFVVCTQILSMVPPAIFTMMIEAGVQQKYGIIATCSFFLVAIGFLTLTCSWEEIVEEAKSEVGELTSDTI